MSLALPWLHKSFYCPRAGLACVSHSSRLPTRLCSHTRVLGYSRSIAPTILNEIGQTKCSEGFHAPLPPRGNHTGFHSSSGVTSSSPYKVTRAELHALVEQYDGNQESANEEPQGGVVLESRNRQQWQQRQHTSQGATEALRYAIEQFSRLLQDDTTPTEPIWDQYCKLPDPGAAYISKNHLAKFLRRLSLVPYKTEPDRMRYLSIVSDMLAAGKTVPLFAWTSAINFAGRCVKRISNTEVESCLNLWKQMESEAGVRASAVTFSVLFDIASKAGKFVLAEMILREMRTRGHRMNRHFRTNLIYFYGLKKDGSGVRKAYKSFVDSGEIVDTAVISCLIEALLKCDEPVAADMVFERAKRLHAQRFHSPLPPHGWRERRQLGRMLRWAARQEDRSRQQVQESAPVAPGVHAYRALVYYYAVSAGDIERVSKLVDEMESYNIPLHGAIFLHVFKGFAMHGGVLYSSWSRRKLETMFLAYANAVSTTAGNIYVGKAAVELCLSAFAKCAGQPRTDEVWDELRAMWKPTEQERSEIELLLTSLSH